jgi:oligopeptidase A
VFDLDATIAKETTLIPRLPEDRFLCSFAHIFGGGYAAGYYS